MLLPYSIFAQATNQQPGQDVGASDASTIIDGALNGSRLVVSSFNQDWQDFANGNSAVYTTIVAVCLLIAVVLIAFWSIGWYAEIANYGFTTTVVNQMIYPIIVVLMLGVSHGALLADTSLMFRGVSNYINDKILDMTRNGVTYREAIRSMNMNEAFQVVLSEKIKDCQKEAESITDANGNVKKPRKNCTDKVIQDAKQQADNYREKNQLSSTPNSWNPLDIAGEAFNSAVQGVAFIIFSGLEAGFQFGLQVSFLLNAYIGPIFLVLSLLPLGAKPVYAWLSGWLALALTLISYSIIVGIAASSIVNAPATNPLFLQLIEAIFSPILAVAIGVGGGMALFSGFTSVAKLFFNNW